MTLHLVSSQPNLETVYRARTLKPSGQYHRRSRINLNNAACNLPIQANTAVSIRAVTEDRLCRKCFPR